MLDSNDLRFLKKRKTFSRTWNFVAIGLLLALGTLFLWLFFKSPNMVNPFHVVSQIKADTLENSTLLLMATLFPITVCFCIFITAICIIFGFAVFANERRYIRIIEKLVRDPHKPEK